MVCSTLKEIISDSRRKIFEASVCFGRNSYSLNLGCVCVEKNQCVDERTANLVQMCPRTSVSKQSRQPLCFSQMRTEKSYRFSFIS